MTLAGWNPQDLTLRRRLRVAVLKAASDAVTTARAVTLPAGSNPTVTLNAGTLTVGLPLPVAGRDGTTLTGATATALPPTAAPTAAIDGTTLAIGVPVGQAGAALTAFSVGTAPVTALLLGATSDVTVTLSTSMPGSSYTAVPNLIGANIGAATLTIITRTTTTVTVRVKANVALAAGTVLVAAWA